MVTPAAGICARTCIKEVWDSAMTREKYLHMIFGISKKAVSFIHRLFTLNVSNFDQ